MSSQILKKKSITFEGTSNDINGTISLTSMCDGVFIEKDTDQGREEITLTMDELNAIVDLIKEHFHQKES